ncbi:hypothetical protein [Polyangium spumosum]|uniref:Uncharacterized protein n=1 Tax=Polyangium spumosum TaxID=889282 RepID=A0A6N7PXU3_9BACT|nr:hypothetical protein [Polyangium spumosum]MRG96367.1 hypothetical protein [Polyangium spumosum]
MSNTLEPLALDTLVFDCTPLESFLVDLARGARRGMLIERENFAEVIAEIMTNQADFGGKAGITQEDFDAFQESGARIALVDAFLPAVRKLCERLEETRAQEEDKRQRQALSFAVSVERRAKNPGNKHLLAKYERTRAYRSATGFKAAKTRARNLKAATIPTPAEG